MKGADALLKRINVLSSMLVLIAVVSLSGLLYSLDADENQHNASALTILSLVKSIPDPDELLTKRGNLSAGIYAWLGEAQNPFDKQRRHVRQQLIDWMQSEEVGIAVSDEAIGRLAGKPGVAGNVPDEAVIPFYLFHASVSEAGERQNQESPRFVRDASVVSLVAKLRRLDQRTNLTIATNITLEKPPQLGKGEWKLLGVTLREETVTIQFEEILSQIVQSIPEIKSVDFPVKTVNVEGPTLLSLYLSTRRENTLRSLERLLGENWHLEYLSTRYGLLPIKEARSVSGRELARSFESVDVLGFSFSPQHFPIAIIALSFVVLLAILATLESARRCSIKFSDVLTDSTLQVVTERRLGRSFLWVFVPGISVWAALPSALLPAQELLTLVFGIVILVILGLACLGRSIDLF